MIYKLKFDTTSIDNISAKSGQACVVKRSYQVTLKGGVNRPRVDVELLSTGQIMRQVDPRDLTPVRFDNAGERVG